MNSAERAAGGDKLRFSGLFRRTEGKPEGNGIHQLESREQTTPAEIVLKDIDSVDNEGLQAYVNFLKDPRNRFHFANVPEDVRKLKKWGKEPTNHFLFATRIEKDNEGKDKEVVVGGAEVQDAAPNQQDHFLSLVVVDPDKQKQGIGTELIRKIIDWASLTKTSDGRSRDKLDLAIVMGVPNWKRMERLVETLGFRLVHILPNQVDVPILTKDGIVMERKSTKRFELSLDNWRTIRDLPNPNEPKTEPSK